MSQTNTPFNDGTANDDFGIDKEKINLLDTDEMRNKSIGYMLHLNKAKLTKNYTPNCKKDENPYPPVEIKKTPAKNPKKTKINYSNPYDFPKGLVIPVYNKVYTPILVPKMKRAKCYKKETPIKDNTAKLGEACSKDSHCIKGYCHGAFLKIKKGTCKKKRKKSNIAEGEKCKYNRECNEGLVCVNNLGGLKLGYCKKKKNNKKT